MILPEAPEEDGGQPRYPHFPVHACCVTHDAGYPASQEHARQHLVIGQVYTVRAMQVHQSSTSLQFYEIPGTWGAEFFAPADHLGNHYVLPGSPEPTTLAACGHANS